jgi:hypothetical protein
MLQGNTTKARAAYEDFLALWKDADPDVPILSEAKAEYAKLQRSCASTRFQRAAGVSMTTANEIVSMRAAVVSSVPAPS